MSSRSLPIQASVGIRGSNRREDVIVIQMALRVLKDRSSHRPFYEAEIDGIAGDRTVQAIEAFQSPQNDPSAGTIHPNDPDHRRLTEEVRRELRQSSHIMAPYLDFDGRKLCWMGRREPRACWAAVSGAPGFQSKEFQAVKDKGPLPEGKWRVRQDRYQRFDDESLVTRLGAYLSMPFGEYTNWPGGKIAWGNHRIWIEPAAGTDALGRSGFSIHGGWFAGTAGCVDLTDQMSSFAERFRSYGADMDLVVRY